MVDKLLLTFFLVLLPITGLLLLTFENERLREQLRTHKSNDLALQGCEASVGPVLDENRMNRWNLELCESRLRQTQQVMTCILNKASCPRGIETE